MITPVSLSHIVCCVCISVSVCVLGTHCGLVCDPDKFDSFDSLIVL